MECVGNRHDNTNSHPERGVIQMTLRTKKKDQSDGCEPQLARSGGCPLRNTSTVMIE